MSYWRAFLGLVFITCVTLGCENSNKEKHLADVLIAGGGASGFSAAIQAARSGSDVVIVEETEWLGGMISAAGVSATDGNHRLPSGIWGEFRQRIYDHYGGPEKVATGWVSNTHFLPNVADSIMKRMISEYQNITVHYGYRVSEVKRDENQVTGAVFTSVTGNDKLEIDAKVVIDATELGDLIKESGAVNYIGQDPIGLTGENLAPTERTPYIQDLTYVAILKDYGSSEGKHVLTQPPNYDQAEFNCMCKELCDDPEFAGVGCDKMLNYAELPGGYFMINWPNDGNDYYLNPIQMTYTERDSAFQKARNRTLNWIYHLQEKGGYKKLGIADDIFSTEDGLALIPYHRESRRIKALEMLTSDDLKDPFRSDLYKKAIAVGDYPLDHHHKKNPLAHEEFVPEISFPIPSFSIPLTVLVPEKINGLIAAEKSIGVSHLANGSTRLQPCVLGIGQAAGALAAFSAIHDINPREIPLRQIQQVLLENDCWLLPYIDIKPEEDHFIPLQKMGLTGLIKGNPVPYKWANQTWIYPDSLMTEDELSLISKRLGIPDTLKPSTRKQIAIMLEREIDLFSSEHELPLTEFVQK